MSATCEISIDSILKNVGMLPSPPHAVLEIIRTLEDGDAPAETLARKIEADMGLLAHVLRLVNTPYYATEGRVSSIQQAIMLLGLNEIRNLACMHGIADYFQEQGASNFDYQSFICHSAGVGCVARQLARPALLNPDTAFVAGMLHDIGQLALAITLPQQFDHVLAYRKQHNCTLEEAELAIIGIDHAQVGGNLMRHWHLPEEICEAIAYHHQTADIAMFCSPMSDLLHVSEVLAHALELGSSEQVPPMDENAIPRLGLTREQLAHSFGRIEEDYCDLTNILGIH
jgi:putative nucleotidyltransferase with HDIG domain